MEKGFSCQLLKNCIFIDENPQFPIRIFFPSDYCFLIDSFEVEILFPSLLAPVMENWFNAFMYGVARLSVYPRVECAFMQSKLSKST